jgi:hypothetical protein
MQANKRCASGAIEIGANFFPMRPVQTTDARPRKLRGHFNFAETVAPFTIHSARNAREKAHGDIEAGFS